MNVVLAEHALFQAGCGITRMKFLSVRGRYGANGGNPAYTGIFPVDGKSRPNPDIPWEVRLIALTCSLRDTSTGARLYLQ
jgi:hypothetical protein